MYEIDSYVELEMFSISIDFSFLCKKMSIGMLQTRKMLNDYFFFVDLNLFENFNRIPGLNFEIT